MKLRQLERRMHRMEARFHKREAPRKVTISFVDGDGIVHEKLLIEGETWRWVPSGGRAGRDDPEVLAYESA